MLVYVVQIWLNYPPSGQPPGWYTVDADDDFTAAHLKAAQRSRKARVVKLTGAPVVLSEIDDRPPENSS